MRFGARNEEAHKNRPIRDPNEDEIETVEWLSSNFFIFFFFTTHACDIRQWKESKENGGIEREGEKERSTNAVKYHSSGCRIRFTAISFAICRS